MNLDLDLFENSDSNYNLQFVHHTWIPGRVGIRRYGKTWPNGMLEALRQAAESYECLELEDALAEYGFVDIRSNRDLLRLANAIASQFEAEGIKVQRVLYSSRATPDQKEIVERF